MAPVAAGRSWGYLDRFTRLDGLRDALRRLVELEPWEELAHSTRA